MKPPDDPFLDVAAAILDGQDVDWPSVESTMPPADRTLIREFQVLSGLAAFHRHPDVRSAPAGVPWGPFHLLESVGRGRYGEVFRAWDTRLDREVALKLLNEGVCRFASVDSAIEEGRLLARVRHPNVVAVYGAERIDGRVGIWTEFVRGRTLEQLVRERGRIDADEAIRIGIEVCRALSAVHVAGLVHRDVKAQNVMRAEDGRIVLMDFGAVTETRRGENAVHDVAGTPLYLAPEIVRGEPADARSDVYSVGVLLFHLVTGDYPVMVGQSWDDLDRAHRDGSYRSVRDGRADLPTRFCEIVDRALSPHPIDRFESAESVERALERALQDSRGDKASRWRATPQWMALVAITSMALIGMAFGLARARRGANGGVPPASTILAANDAGHTPMMRKVMVPPMGLRGGAPSFDGRFFANTDLDENLIVVDLARGTSRRLTNSAGANEAAEFSVTSPDGEWVAYSWLTSDDRYELRVIRSTGGQPRLLAGSTDIDEVIPIEWSRDGRDLLALAYRERMVQAMLIDVADGRRRVVHQFQGATPQRVSLSPDGRFIVFDYPSSAAVGVDRDIFIAATDATWTRSLVVHPANDVNPVWTPDGLHVLFVSDRSGTPDAWSVRVDGGVPQGEPELVGRNVGRVALAGFTASGALYYWLQTGSMDVFTAPWGDHAAHATRVASRFVGLNSGPAYSPDGRFLAYLSQRTLLRNVPGSEVVVIRNLTLMSDREIVPDLRLGVVSPQWSPDGRRLLVRGTDRQNRTGIFILSLQDGTVAPGVVVELTHTSDVRQFGWWIDGHSIVYNSPAGITVRDPESGAEFRPFERAGSLRGLRVAQFGLSPDGRSFAFSAVVEGTDPPARVVDVMTIGGTPRELVRATFPEQVFFQDWLPGGDEVLFTRRRTDTHMPHALWRASTDGRATSDTGITIPGFTQVNGVKVQPHGRMIAYTAGEASWELWVMEHFLHEAGR